MSPRLDVKSTQALSEDMSFCVQLCETHETVAAERPLCRSRGLVAIRSLVAVHKNPVLPVSQFWLRREGESYRTEESLTVKSFNIYSAPHKFTYFASFNYVICYDLY